MEASKVLIQANHLDKSFPGVKALQDVSFELCAGEVHALMGENGAGKSTLMKILSGVYQKDAGEVFLDGKQVDIHGPAHANSLGIGIVHQELHLMPHLTAAQNVYIGREPRKMGGLLLDEDRLNRDAAELFRRIHLDVAPTTRISTLTVARQQMVEIAKALSHQSRVLIMDEPTAALNDAEIEELFGIVRKLRAEGVGIVYISHKMDEIQRISDRITVMRDGCTVGTVPASTPISTIITMMVGRELKASQKTIPDVSEAPAVLEVKGLQRGRQVRDISFKVRRGEIVGFAGLMGAGRTEVMRAIFGADRLEAGEIHVHGQRVHVREPYDAVAAGIGYLSEDRKHFGLATGMAVEPNITLPSLPRWLKWGFYLNRPASEAISNEMVKRLRIKTPSIHQLSKLLSGGNQQKVVIAKWLVRDCDVLIFDEPTRGIDVGAKAEIYTLLNELAAQGRAIVVISSELPEVLHLSHRILVMCEGRITGEVHGADATQENLMALATKRESMSNASNDRITTLTTPTAAAADVQAKPAVPTGAAGSRLGGATQILLAFGSLIALIVIFSVLKPDAFMTTDNLIGILQSTNVIGVMAVAVTFVIITSGIDLSVGVLMTFTAVMAGVFMTNWGWPMAVGVPATIAAGALVGAVNGLIITRLKVTPFIATLGMMMLLKGASLLITSAKPIYFSDVDGFDSISLGSLVEKVLPFLPIPNGSLIFLAVAVVSAFLLKKTALGRYTFALGSNEEAVRLSGVNTDRWKVIVYTLCGGICSFSGLLVASRLNSAQPALGQGYELDAIAAVVIGGTSLAGGTGTILGTVIGAFIMSVLINGLRIMSVAQEWQMVLTGLIIILAVYTDNLRNRRQ